MPVFWVRETPARVVVAIRLKSGSEHLTLHREEDGTILKTYWDSTKPTDVWEDLTVEAGRNLLRNKNPENHAKYIFHMPLSETMHTSWLVSRHVKLKEIKPSKAKHQRVPRIELRSTMNEITVDIHLSAAERPHEPSDAPHITTGFGDICFRVGPSRRAATPGIRSTRG